MSFSSEKELGSIEENNNISNVYAGSTVFITGATGFVGKVLLEKLLRSCRPKNVYVLIREKRGLSVEQRLKKIFECAVFDKIREDGDGSFKKVKVMYGDVAQDNLGLNEDNRKIIIEEVSFVFHSAATIKFTQALQETITLNTLGTKQMVELCKNIKNLKSFVFVSTAYSNADKGVIAETVYDPPYNPHSITDCIINTLPVEVTNMIADKLIKKHPNNYTFSKALAESIILEYSEVLPIAIVRPSIVCASWKEPFKGWVELAGGGISLVTNIFLGTVRSVWVNEDVPIDLIPVDVVVNTMLAAAWDTATHRKNGINVYNCTSGKINGIKIRDYLLYIKKYSRIYPTKHVFLYPDFTNNRNQKIHEWYALLFQYFPAFIFDMYLYITNQKPMLYNMQKKISDGFKQYQFVLHDEKPFEVSEFQNLVEKVKNAEDADEFMIDVSQEVGGLNWEEYVRNLILGIRKGILKDDLSSLPRAKAKMNRLYWIGMTIKIFWASVLLFMLSSVLLKW